jgi:hypothetical protein
VPVGGSLQFTAGEGQPCHQRYRSKQGRSRCTRVQLQLSTLLTAPCLILHPAHLLLFKASGASAGPATDRPLAADHTTFAAATSRCHPQASTTQLLRYLSTTSYKLHTCCCCCCCCCYCTASCSSGSTSTSYTSTTHTQVPCSHTTHSIPAAAAAQQLPAALGPRAPHTPAG